MTITPSSEWPRGSEALVVGESLVDIVIPRDGKPATRPGGSPMNVAVGLARLGAAVSLATQLGDDVYGRLVAEHLRNSGVTIRPDSIRPGATTSSATATIGEDGAATYDFALDWDISAPDPAEAALVHAGSIAAFLEPGAEAVLRCLHDAPGVASLDLNVRPSIVPDRTAAVRQASRLAEAVDIVKLSDEDAGWLHPGASLEEVAEDYSGRGAALVVITRGRSGSIVFLGTQWVEVPAPAVTVADTIGAGDSYMAGLLYALLARGFGTAGAAPFPLSAATEAAQFAASCAAVTVQRVGADLPHLDDVLRRSDIG